MLSGPGGANGKRVTFARWGPWEGGGGRYVWTRPGGPGFGAKGGWNTVCIGLGAFFCPPISGDENCVSGDHPFPGKEKALWRRDFREFFGAWDAVFPPGVLKGGAGP